MVEKKAEVITLVPVFEATKKKGKCPVLSH